MRKHSSIFWLLIIGLFISIPTQATAKNYRIVVIGAKLFPTKQNRSCWDPCTKLSKRSLYNVSSKLAKLSGKTGWSIAMASKGALKAAKGLKLPDPYVTVKFGNGQVIKTKTADNTLLPVWGTTKEFPINKSDSIEIFVRDKDLRNDDSVGFYSTPKLPSYILKKGGLWTLRFHRVYELKILFTIIKKTWSKPFTAGRYKVTITRGTAFSTKLNGKPWDVFRGKPDPYVKLRIGKNTITTHREKNTLRPTWNTSRIFQLTGSEIVHIEIFDRDYKRHDLMGTCTFNSLHVLPLRNGDIFREKCGQFKELRITFKKLK